GRDKVITIGKPGEERLEHPRRRGKSVQQEKRRRVLRTGLSVEDGEPIYLSCAIKSRVLHGTSLSLGLGQQLRRGGHHAKRQRHAAGLHVSARMGQAEEAHRLPPLTADGTKCFCPIEGLHVLSKIALKFGNLPKPVSVLMQTP